MAHGVEPQVFFGGIFFVGTFKERIYGIALAGILAFREGVQIDAEGNFRNIAVIDPVSTDIKVFCPFFEVLGALSKTVAKHGSLRISFF